MEHERDDSRLSVLAPARQVLAPLEDRAD